MPVVTGDKPVAILNEPSCEVTSLTNLSVIFRTSAGAVFTWPSEAREV